MRPNDDVRPRTTSSDDHEQAAASGGDGETGSESRKLPDTLDGQAARVQLYDVMDDESLSLPEKRSWALEIGRRYLDSENGHVERIDGGTHEVVASVGGPLSLLPEGERLPAGRTYCRRTIQQDSALALSDAGAEGWESDPAYDEHGFDCYLGASVVVDGDTYGTVCFISRDARSTTFTEDERTFVELVARLLGRELEANNYRAALDEESRHRQREARLRSGLFAAAPDAILVVDETDEIVEANSRAASLTDYAESELLGRSLRDLCVHDDWNQYATTLRHAVERDGTVDTFTDGRPLELCRADDTTVPVALSAGAVTVDGKRYRQLVLRDVTDRRERREELRLKDRVFDEVDVGLTIADADEEDFPLAYVNDAFEEMTGYERSDALGLNCRFLQGPNTDPESVAEIRAALDAEETLRTQLRNYRRDGTPFWNELTVTPIENDDGRVTHFAGIQRDVTERERRERLIRVLNRVIRHNLRNELNVIQGYAQSLADRTDGERPPELDKIVDTTAGLVETTETARQLETLADEDRELQPTRVVPAVREAAAAVREAHPDATVEVASVVDADRVALATDRLRDVVAELIENAVVHTDAATAHVRIAPQTDGDGLHVHVTDDGDGIPEQDRRVLTGGEETKLDHASSLGVWLVAWLVDEFGGRVDVRESDTGTTVTVTLLSAEE
jgi:PAS domain S-box-containing protein